MPSIEHLHASPQRFDWSAVEDLSALVVLPEPSADDLEEHGCSPDDLRDGGHDVPEDEGEALAFAKAEFEKSDGYRDWADGFLPVMAALWPCRPAGDVRLAASAMRREGLACTLVSGRIGGAEVMGIALTGGGMDLSDHIAAAYILCGHVPPVAVLERATEHSSPKMREEIAEAALQAAGALEAQAGRIRSSVATRSAPGFR